MKEEEIRADGNIKYTVHGHTLSIYSAYDPNTRINQPGYFIIGESVVPGQRDKIAETIGAGQAMVEIPLELIEILMWHAQINQKTNLHNQGVKSGELGAKSTALQRPSSY